jgi:mRNA-degrading endonuclease RelE of RelBE toxin-antitoxin system
MKVLLTADAEKQFQKLPKSERSKVLKKLQLLTENPQAGKKLAGAYAEQRSLRAWPYRIIYAISTTVNQEAIIVLAILHRRGAYK